MLCEKNVASDHTKGIRRLELLDLHGPGFQNFQALLMSLVTGRYHPVEYFLLCPLR